MEENKTKVPANKEKKKRRGGKKRKRVFFLLLALIFIFVLCLGFSPLGKELISSFRLSQITVLLEGGSNFSFNNDGKVKIAPMGDHIAVVSASTLSLYTNKGEQVYAKTVSTVTPCLDTNGRNAIVYSRKSNDITVFSDNGQIGKLEMEFPILSASINEEGYICVVTQSQGYTAEVIVYNTDYDEVYHWYSSSSYVLDAKLSPDSARLAAATIRMDEDRLNCGVSVFSLKEKEPIAVRSVPGYVHSLQFKTNRLISVVCDDQTLLIDQNGKDVGAFSYQAKTLITNDVSERGYHAFVLARAGTESASELYLCDDTGNLTGTLSLPDTPVKRIRCAYGKVFVLTRNKLFIYSNTLALEREYDTGPEYFDLLPVSYKDAYLFNASNAVFVRPDKKE